MTNSIISLRLAFLDTMTHNLYQKYFCAGNTTIMENEIRKAEAAIGEQQIDDWQISPQQFPNQLKDSAPALASLLSDSSFEEKGKRYNNADTLAVDYQSRFRARAQAASIAIFVSAAATAFLSSLPIASEMMGDTMKPLSLIGGILVFIASGVAIFNTQMISQLKLYDQWMQHRAKAEAERLSYFKTAADRLVAEPNTPKELVIQFCCFFRRYQLQVQQSYFEGRSQQHADSLRKSARLGAIAAVIVAGFSGSAGLAGFFNTDLMDFAALGTIGVALTALSSRLESINQDERNAIRYQKTADILSQIAEKYSSVQRSIAQGGNYTILLKFVDAVHEQLSSEHRQWTEDAADISSAYAELVKAEENA